MEIELTDYHPSFLDQVHRLLSTNSWDFHRQVSLTPSYCQEHFSDTYFTKAGTKTFLLLNKENQLAGYVRVFDLGEDPTSDETPLFDIRIDKQLRNLGIGKQAVQKVVTFIFSNYLNKHRIEAATRADNVRMQAVLLHCGFVKEAHYRQAWKDSDDNLYDAAGYGLLRADWQSDSPV